MSVYRTVRTVALILLAVILSLTPLPARQDAGSAHHAATAEAPGDSVESRIAAARGIVKADPENAGVHLALARELAAAIQQNPMAGGPLYSADMLRSLERALELDPTLVEAYRYLVGFYLQAPPIAGGSLERAEETARKLAEHDAAAGEELLQRVARSREGREASH